MHRLLLSVRYDSESNKAQMLWYDLESKSLVKEVDNTGHKPYCLTDVPGSEITGQSWARDLVLQCETVEKFDLLREKTVTVTKVIVDKPTDVIKVRNHLPRTWESHIRYHHNWIYDLEIIPGGLYVKKQTFDESEFAYELVKDLPEESSVTVRELQIPREIQEMLNQYGNLMDVYRAVFNQPIPQIKCAAIDIETRYGEFAFPSPKEAKYPVIAAAMASNEGSNIVFLLREGEHNEDSMQTLKVKESDQNVHVRYFSREEDLLRALFEELDNYPLIFTFNGDNFDFAYLYQRAKNLKLDHPFIVRGSGGRGGREYLLNNSVHVDLYQFFSNPAIKASAYGNAYPTNSLDDIADVVLGERKIQLDERIDELELEALATYCLNDAQLTLQLALAHDRTALQLMILLGRICKTPLEDLNRSRVSSWIRNLLYYEHRRKNYLIPNQEDIHEAIGEVIPHQALMKEKRFKGGFVVDPIPGVHFNVAVLDFASLYPSIISSRNLSYETMLCRHPECTKNLLGDTDYWTCMRRKGMLANLLGFFRDVRVLWFKTQAKKKDNPLKSLHTSIEKGLKVLINATYGVMGSEFFPLSHVSIADGTAATGRWAIRQIIARAEQLGVRVLYGDTDSVFLESPTKEVINALIKWSTEQLGFDLELEKIYRVCILSKRKKNYLGILEDGSHDIKGLLGKKRNTPPFIQQAFQEMVDILTELHDPVQLPEIKEQIKKLLKRYYNFVEKRKIPIEQLAITVQLTKNPEDYEVETPFVKAAKQLEEKFGRKITKGMIIRYVRTSTPEGSMAVELAKPSDIDVATYKTYLDSTFEQIIDVLGISTSEIHGQVNLMQFFQNQ